MIKVNLFAWTVSPLVLLSLISSPVTLAQSQGPAGFPSGNAPTAGSQTPISVPVTVTPPGGIQPFNDLITIVPGTNGGPLTIIIPPTITTAVNEAGTNIIIVFRTGSLTQQQIATLTSAIPTIVTSLEGEVQGTITVSIIQDNNTIGTVTAATLGEAASLSTEAVANAPANGIVVLEIGDVTVRISPSNRTNLNLQ